MTALLDIRDITVRFGGLVANNAVNLTVAEGEIAALIGPNGAGKTTLFNVVTGAQAPTAGQVVFAGADITGLSPESRAGLGIARTFHAFNPRLLLLDEPSAGMGWAATAELAATIRRVRDRLSVTVLVVEHDMAFVRRLAERTTVLDSGRVIASGPTAEVLADERVVAVYLGTGAGRA